MNVHTSSIGVAYNTVWKSNSIALVASPSLSQANAILFRKKSPWQMTANGSMGNERERMYLNKLSSSINTCSNRCKNTSGTLSASSDSRKCFSARRTPLLRAASWNGCIRFCRPLLHIFFVNSSNRGRSVNLSANEEPWNLPKAFSAAKMWSNDKLTLAFDIENPCTEKSDMAMDALFGSIFEW